MKFAVVDIETTGLYHQGHDITEIAVVHVTGDKIEQVFHSLVHTNKVIPAQVSGLTGIRNRDTNDAPVFASIQQDLLAVLEGRVFVAHNVNFDYQFLKAYFEREGIDYRPARLCSMRFAKKVVPGLRSYKLQALCQKFGIDNTAAHRAYGDAMATAQLLVRLLKVDDGSAIKNLLNQNSRNTILPPGISANEIESIPESPGVYHFFNDRDERIYIGKAKNLKRRILSHFTASGSSRKKQLFQRSIARFELKITATEYEALLLEDAEIKAYWPPLNVAQKHAAFSYAITTYRNRADELRFGILRTRYQKEALGWFTSTASARKWLQEQLIERDINPRRGGFYAQDNSQLDDANAVEEFIEERKNEMAASYALVLPGEEEIAFFAAIIEGKYRGYGNLNFDEKPDKSQLNEALVSAPDSLTARAVIQQMMNDDKVLKYEF